MGADPNKIRLTGENLFLRIGASEDADPTAENSHWRIVATLGNVDNPTRS